MNVGYALSEIRKHGTDRTWWRARLFSRVLSRYYAVRGNPGERLVDADWDNAVVLDACRYDLFAETYGDFDLPGELGERTSRASATPGFLRENFDGESFHDIVYVTGNPYVATELSDAQFHSVEHVWKDGWDDEVGTVTPETMRRATLDAASDFPDKRIVSHFMQPHTPFIGQHEIGDRDHFTIRDRALGDESTVRDALTPFERLEVGDLSADDVWRAYRSNLEHALPAVGDLLDSLQGKTVVTSDHGNGMGEFASPFPIRVFGHPEGILVPPLTRVPYFEGAWEDRKGTTAEPPATTREPSEDVGDRLRMLGYAE